MENYSLVPWHMWGNNVTVEIGLNAPGVGFAATKQLVRISYKRPESWRFLLAATLVEATDVDTGHLPPPSVEILVRYKLVTGIGRGSVEIPDWQGLTWKYAPTPPLGETLWTCHARDRISDILNTLPTPVPCDLVVGQDIQLSAEIDLLTTSLLPVTARLQIHAYFSPVSHFRPDWLRGSTVGIGGS